MTVNMSGHGRTDCVVTADPAAAAVLTVRFAPLGAFTAWSDSVPATVLLNVTGTFCEAELIGTETADADGVAATFVFGAEPLAGAVGVDPLPPPHAVTAPMTSARIRD